MSKILRFLGLVMMLLIVVLAAALVQPEWARDLGLESCIKMARGYRAFWLQDDREIYLNRQASNRRYSAKQRLIVELLDGQRTLFEAAALFRRWDAEYPVLPIPAGVPGDSEEEQFCWQVIDWAKKHLYLSGLDSSEASVRLKEELRRHKEQHGKVILPEAPAVN
jgi:hypothetical protein